MTPDFLRCLSCLRVVVRNPLPHRPPHQLELQMPPMEPWAQTRYLWYRMLDGHSSLHQITYPLLYYLPGSCTNQLQLL